MQKQFMGRWGFIISGVLFMVAALIPAAGGKSVNVTFFTLAIAMFVIGAAIVRRNRSAK